MLREEKGAAALEFALTIPIVMFTILAIISLALYFNARTGVDGAAREGARVYAIRYVDHGSSGHICSNASDDATEAIMAYLDDYGLRGDIVNITYNNDYDDRIIVGVDYPMDGVYTPPPLLGWFTADWITGRGEYMVEGTYEQRKGIID